MWSTGSGPKTAIIPYGLKTLLECVCRSAIIEKPTHIPDFISQYCCDLIKYRDEFPQTDTKEVLRLYQENRESSRAEVKAADVQIIHTHVFPAGEAELVTFYPTSPGDLTSVSSHLMEEVLTLTQRHNPLAVELDPNVEQPHIEGCTLNSSEAPQDLEEFHEVPTTGDPPGRKCLEEVPLSVIVPMQYLEGRHATSREVINKNLLDVLSTEASNNESLQANVQSFLQDEESAVSTDVKSTEYTQISSTSSHQDRDVEITDMSSESTAWKPSSINQRDVDMSCTDRSVENQLQSPSECDEVSQEDQEVAEILSEMIVHCEECPPRTQSCLRGQRKTIGEKEEDTANTCSHSDVEQAEEYMSSKTIFQSSSVSVSQRSTAEEVSSHTETQSTAEEPSSSVHTQKSFTEEDGFDKLLTDTMMTKLSKKPSDEKICPEETDQASSAGPSQETDHSQPQFSKAEEHMPPEISPANDNQVVASPSSAVRSSQADMLDVTGETSLAASEDDFIHAEPEDQPSETCGSESTELNICCVQILSQGSSTQASLTEQCTRVSTQTSSEEVFSVSSEHEEDKSEDTVSGSAFPRVASCASQTTQTTDEAEKEQETISTQVFQQPMSNGNTYIQNYGSGQILLVLQCPHLSVPYRQPETHDEPAASDEGISSMSVPSDSNSTNISSSNF